MRRLSIAAFFILTHAQWVFGAIDCERKLSWREEDRRNIVSSITASFFGHALLVGAFVYVEMSGSHTLELDFAGKSGESDAIEAIFLTGQVVEAPQEQVVKMPPAEIPTQVEKTPVETTPAPRPPVEIKSEIPPMPEHPTPEISTPVQQAPPPQPEQQPTQPAAQPSQPTQPIEHFAVAPALTEESLLSLRENLDRFIIYPPVAKENEVTGTVVMGFQVQPDGRIHNLIVVRSSGFRILDKEALRAMAELSRDWVYPGAQSDLKRAPYDVVYPIEFKLNKN